MSIDVRMMETGSFVVTLNNADFKLVTLLAHEMRCACACVISKAVGRGLLELKADKLQKDT